jgi:hypothetical protein
LLELNLAEKKIRLTGKKNFNFFFKLYLFFFTLFSKRDICLKRPEILISIKSKKQKFPLNHDLQKNLQHCIIGDIFLIYKGLLYNIYIYIM